MAEELLETGGALPVVSSTAGGGGDAGSTPIGDGVGGNGRVAVIDVEGMMCAACVGIVKNLLGRVSGVTATEVSLPLERATVHYDPTIITPEQLVEAVEDGGYEANVHAVDEEGDLELNDPEEKAAKMRAAARSARTSFVGSLCFSLPLVVISMGFRSKDKGGLSAVLFTEIMPGLPLRSVLEWILATPVQFVFGARFYKSAANDLRNRALGMNFLVAGGTTAAYLYSVVLVLLAISTKTHASMLFFETSAILISFVFLGKYLEQLARGKASNAVGKLLDLRADRAVLVSDWPACELAGELDVDASDLVVGNVVKVVRGAKVPADGVVVRGNAAVDESMVTGESMPVHKEEGCDVIGATVCSEGLVYAKVTRTGKASALQQIVRLVEQAQGSKAPIQEVGDRVASIFVPCVVCLSLLTLAVWLALTMSGVVPEKWYRDQPGEPGPALFSFMFSLAVMVIACPCAVGLAAPTAILVGTGVAARNGVLIKGGAALQRVSELKRVVFDKTGTLTMGKPRVTEVAYVESEGLSEALSKREVAAMGGEEEGEEAATRGRTLVFREEVLRLVASAERGSEHPLAKAIVEFHSLSVAGRGDASDCSLDRLEMPEDGSTTAVSGKGISCTVGGLKVSIGSPGYIERVTGKPPASLVELLVGSLESSGRTVVVATIEGHVAGLFAMVDTLRPEAKGVVSVLTRMGLEVWMLTGDNRRAALEVGRRAGLPADRVCAEVLPGDKASKIQELQMDGKAVAMIGDGINDAPALATADVGVAVGGGTDVAMESADVVLMSSSLWDVLTSLDLCRTIVNRVRLNYFWALLYNTIGLPVAAGVFFPLLKVPLPPAVAGGAMALSSVSVLLSSLALRLYRRPAAVRKAARVTSAARSSSKPSVVGSGRTTATKEEEEEEQEAQFEPATEWTVDLSCMCSCCRSGATTQLAAIAGAAKEGLRHRSGAKPHGDVDAIATPISLNGPVGSCCQAAAATTMVPWRFKASEGNTAASSLSSSMRDGGDVASYRAASGVFRVGGGGGGDPEQGRRGGGCSCSCSFCQCMQAIEP